MSSNLILKIIIIHTLLLINLIQTFSDGSCLYRGKTYENNRNWQIDCQNCSCQNSIPICQEIVCKYTPCSVGKILVLNQDKCCPSCEFPKTSCNYKDYIIEHNTEFSPKLCETCRCKNGQMECLNTCSVKSDILSITSTSFDQRKNLFKKNKNRNRKHSKHPDAISNDVRTPCIHEGNVYEYNTTWTPFKCTRCKCNLNSEVDCFVKECPEVINCQQGIEVKSGECCPTCIEATQCLDSNGMTYKNGEVWTKHNEPCTHCTCINSEIKCTVVQCQSTTCQHNEILISKSDTCCSECVPEVVENCEHDGRLYYNGHIWYNKGCEHCTCDFGKVVCMQVQCEAQFCLQNEILVKKKDACCVECRKPTYCQINEEFRIKENDFWIPHNASAIYEVVKHDNSEKRCRLCECLQSGLECYSKSCYDSRFPTYAKIMLRIGDKAEVSARNVPFFADIIKSMSHSSLVLITVEPRYTQFKIDDKPVTRLSVGDISESKLFYEFDDSVELVDLTARFYDYVVLSFVGGDSGGKVHNVMIEFEVVVRDESSDDGVLGLEFNSLRTDSERQVRGNDLLRIKSGSFKVAPRKTIFVHPGEAIKLTSNELKPKNLSFNTNEANLIYFLVSGNLKYGDLKLKKVLSYDEQIPVGWSIVNDIYLEKKITEFTQQDLDQGNVWYEPFSTFSSSKKQPKNSNSGSNSNDEIDPILSFSSISSGAKYDHCMFEVYDQQKLDKLISKEIIHFNIQNDVINETILGLEVIENQLTPLTFSNFDIAGIDSTREYLMYRVIKRLEKDQGQLEHAENPGVAIDTFSQEDLNKGYILYNSPKEIGITKKEFSFTFIVSNDNRSDTFPETPFHIKVSPANDQEPKFKTAVLEMDLVKSGSLALPREFFAVEDPDTAIDNMVFTVEKTAENIVIELRARGQRYLISKDDSFTIQEIRDGTFRLVHNGASLTDPVVFETLKVSVSDGKHVSIKTVNLRIRDMDEVAPHVSNKHSTMILNVMEGNTQVIRRENMAFVNDKSSPNQIIYSLIEVLTGKLFLRDVLLLPGMKFTQADIDLKNLKYEAPKEIGPSIVSDQVRFDINDMDGNLIKDQVLTINIEPIDNQVPSVELLQPFNVLEGGFLMLNEKYIRVKDSDSFKEQLNLVIDAQPSFGYIESIKTGNKLTSFPLSDLITGQTIRYVQNDHKNKEPKTDLFIFHVSDGVNNSPTHRFNLNIQSVNDEPPVAFFEPLVVQLNKRIYLSNSTFRIVDFDTSNLDLQIYIDTLPKFGVLYLNDIPVTKTALRFFYSDIVNRQVSYILTTDSNIGDEIKFSITDGKFTTVSKYYILKSLETSLKDVKKIELEHNRGLQAITGHVLQITSDMLKAVPATKTFKPSSVASDLSGNLVFSITEAPKFGKIQFRYQNFYEDLTGPYATLNNFTQKDVDEGRVFYNHASTEPSGITHMSFKLSDQTTQPVRELNDLRFIITVRGDKLPPVVVTNRDLRVNQDKSNFLTTEEINITDDDTPIENLSFHITTQPKIGYLENINEPGKRISQFNYNDLIQNHIRYVHNGYSLSPELISNLNDLFRPNEKEDILDIKISDGKNDVSTSLKVVIINQNKQIPLLKSQTGFTLRLRELERKILTPNELSIQDTDSLTSELKIIVINAPQYGVLELCEANLTYVPVTQFTMKDVERSLVSYKHHIKENSFDKFGFVVYDGVNKLFRLDEKSGQSTSNVQVFNIDIVSEVNFKPVIEKNLGLDYLYRIEGRPGRIITHNELFARDNDDLNTDIVYEVIEQPKYGHLERTDNNIGQGLISSFTQKDVNDNRIFYVMKEEEASEQVTSDWFVFDVRDSRGNEVKGNRFEISWAVVEFEVSELNVMESEGKVRVHVKKSGNLKQFSMVTCKTVSDSAVSNREEKEFDYVQTEVRLEFNEDESYKACDVMIQRDGVLEPIKSFYVVLENAKYSIIGAKQKVKINILDKVKETYVEFERVTYEVHEFQRFISLPIIRVGDAHAEILVECHVHDETAHNNIDYLPRNKHAQNYQFVRIPPNEMYGFCDIEILDDTLPETVTETFRAVLVNPNGPNIKIGLKSETQVSIIGPNDLQSNQCNSIFHTVPENSKQLIVEITRQDSTLNLENFEILVTTAQTTPEAIETYSRFHMHKHLLTKHTGNVTQAQSNEDYLPINSVLSFQPGELTKKVEITILDDANNPVMEGLKIFSIQIKPLTNKNLLATESACNYIDPDFIHVVVQDLVEDAITVGFQASSISVKEPDQVLRVPIIRTGDVSHPFSVICHTRHLTAINEKDFIGRYSLEESRIYFKPGERVKDCVVEIINDSIFEAEEEFQIKLTDLRGPEDAAFGQFTTVLVRILNNEDSSVVSLSAHMYETEEPSGSDSTVIKSITVVRSGDLSRTTVVRVSTSDDTAVAGQDYKPKTETLTFLPGVSALDFNVEIFYDNQREQTESFNVNLGPQDPVSGVFGEVITANVLIHDPSGSSVSTTDYEVNLAMLAKSSQRPFVTSLAKYFINDFENASKGDSGYFSASDKPLVCLHSCESRNPNLAREFCENLKILRVVYGWEISVQDEFGAYSSYVKLMDNSVFSATNSSVLETVYFRHKFRVRCSAQMIIGEEGYRLPVLKSNTVEILREVKEGGESECKAKWQEKENNLLGQKSVVAIDNFNENAQQSSLEKTSYKENKLDINFISNLQAITEPFFARADYISAEFIKQNPQQVDLKYLNYVRFVIDIPFVEGSFPLISTRPLHNYRLLLSAGSAYSAQHTCSNFINEPLIKYGFINDYLKQPKNFSAYQKFSEKYQSHFSRNFYSNLDEKRCGWRFTAYYDISELTSNCQAQIISDSDIRDVNAEKSYLTIRIPIYVSYIYPSYQASWSSIEYKSEIDAFIIYKTKSLDEMDADFTKLSNNYEEMRKNKWADYESSEENGLLNLGGVSKLNHDHLFSLVINKISMNQEGKLIIEFTSIPKFRGQFVKRHSKFKNLGISEVNGPSDEPIEFELEQIWSQYTYEYPEQTWRATSKSILNNYSGNYSLKLIPCYAKQEASFKYPFDCEAKPPLVHMIPIKMEQTMRPIALKYTLDTTLTLNNRPEKSAALEGYSAFDGYFRNGDSIFGTVTWNGDDTSAKNKRRSYKLELEKVYICQSHSKQFIPFFDPETSQFGCSKPHKSLRHRLLVLDKNQNHSNHPSPNQASDNFQLSVDTLFQLANLTAKTPNIEDEPWFIHVTYVISLRNSSGVHKRSANVYSLNNVYNNGTNMQILKLTHKPLKYFEQVFQSQKGKYQRRNERVFSFRQVFLNILLPLFIVSVFILFTAITLVFYRKQIMKNKFWNMHLLTLKKRRKQKLSEFPQPVVNTDHRHSIIVTSTGETNTADYDKNNIYDNYENLMNLKQKHTPITLGTTSSKLNRLQMFLRSSRLYLIRNRAFNKNRTPSDVSNTRDHHKCDGSGSNSTSGTLIASPLLDNTKMMDLTATTNTFKNFDYEYLERPEQDEVFESERVKQPGVVKNRLTLKKISLRTFIQKMNVRKQNLKVVKRIRRSERISSDYENAHQEQSADEEYNKKVLTSQRPLSCVSQISSSLPRSGPEHPIRPLSAGKPCRNNYLYFNYNNNKMNYLNETGITNNNTSIISSGTLSENANIGIKKSDQHQFDNESSLLLNQLAEQHQMTTASAKMFVLSSSPQPYDSSLQPVTYIPSLRESSRALSTSSSFQIPQNQYSNTHIQIRSPSSTSILGLSKQLQNRLSGTEV